MMKKGGRGPMPTVQHIQKKGRGPTPTVQQIQSDVITQVTSQSDFVLVTLWNVVSMNYQADIELVGLPI